MCRWVNYTGRGKLGSSTVRPYPDRMHKAPAVDLFDVENDPLPLAEQAKHATVQRTGPEVYLTPVVVEDHHTGAGVRIVEFDHSLHGCAVYPVRKLPGLR